MPSIKITRQSDHQAEESFSRLTKLLDHDKELRKLDPNYKCDFSKKTLSGEAKSKLFTAKLQITKSSGGSSVEVVVELPFHLALVKGMVQKTLEKKIDEALA